MKAEILLGVLLLFLCVFGLTKFCVADESPSRRGASIAEAEQKALELVKTHLPELESMLDRLRRGQNRQYDRAIRDLARWSKRLELAKKRDAKLFAIEVETLKAENSVNLLAAKLKVRDNQEDRTKLREAVNRLHEAHLARARYDVEFSLERLERVNKQFGAATERLREIESESNTELENTYLGLLKKAGRKP